MINRMEAMTGVDIDGDGDVNDDPPEFTETHKFHVVGGPRAGKSSVIKRIVSHRFDNMPTLNSSFMGVASDGRHLTRLTMPEDVKHAQRGRDILVELQDVVSSLGFKSMLDAPAWHELAAAAAAAEEERRRAEEAAAEAERLRLEELALEEDDDDTPRGQKKGGRKR